MTKIPQTALSMVAALQQMTADGRLKAKAFRFLQDDLSRLCSEDDFRKAFHGLLVCQQLLGPIDAGYRRALDDMRKTLKDYAAQIGDAEAIRRAIAPCAERLIRLLSAKLPKDYHSQIASTVDEVFGIFMEG